MQKPNIIIYTKNNCPYCIKAKLLFNQKKWEYEEINAYDNEKIKKEMMEKSGGMKTFPQIFINDIHIGGCDDLYRKNEDGSLDKIISTE